MCRPGRVCTRCDLMTSACVGGFHAVDAPMAARSAGGVAAAALQAKAMTASVWRASVADPVPERMSAIPANWATADFPRVPWTAREQLLVTAVSPGDDTGTTPTRTAQLNALLGGV